MNIGVNEYAEILRIGERNRDASDKIRGFLYQDILAIDLILNSKKEDKIYVEWVEDIMIENPDCVKLYQVKYYQESYLDLNKIYKSMSYQFFKFKLYENEEKKFKAYCLYYTKKESKFNKHQLNYIKNNNRKIDRKHKETIKKKLAKCDTHSERMTLLFDEFASKDLLSEFCFQQEKKDLINNEREVLKKELYHNFKELISKTVISSYGLDQVQEILLSIAIQYIQKSYYDKLENYKERCMTKESFYNYVKDILKRSKQKDTESIKFLVLGYIDHLFNEIADEIEDIEILKIYKEIYFTTKIFFQSNLETKEQRFKFLNTINMNNYNDFNKDIYMKDETPEIYKFLEHKDKIIEFIRIKWKILFDVDCEDFSTFIMESDECYFFEFPDDKAKPILISSFASRPRRDASNILDKVLKMKIKPEKWYFSNNTVKGIYEYPYSVTKISNVKIEGDFNILLKDHGKYFRIECMKCIKIDEGDMEIKDNQLENCLFSLECREEL